MSPHALHRPSLFLLAATLACGSSPVERQAPVRGATDPLDPAAPTEAANPPTAAPTTEAGAPRAPSAPDPASTETRSPTVFTRISFDLRGMPHRGPYDVDTGLITRRVELLMQRTRDAAGEPAPSLTYTPGISVFRAEFFGPEAAALAQCRRAVAAVAPEPDPPSEPELRPSSEPKATPCTPIGAAAPRAVRDAHPVEAGPSAVGPGAPPGARGGEADAAGSEARPPEAPCEVQVATVLSSESFRGYPSSPAAQRQVEALSAEDFAMWQGESHGASYLLCTYRVIVVGRPWRFAVSHDTTVEDAPPDACEAARPAVEALVRQTTAGCTDLHRGAFYGFDLIPLPE